MIGYRSIGDDELSFLIFSHNPIYGRRIISAWMGCGCKESKFGMVSFFKEPYIWKDSLHKFNLKVDLKGNIEEGIATYKASKDFGKTRIWTGREGKTEYKISELYVRFYNPEDIVELNIGSHFTESFIENIVIPFCKTYHITLVRDICDIKSRKMHTYRLAF